MFRVVLPVFYRTKEMENAPEEMEFKFTEYDVRDVIFYEIQALGIYEEDEIQYTTIYSGGNYFYSPKSRNEIDRLIMQAKLNFSMQ